MQKRGGRQKSGLGINPKNVRSVTGAGREGRHDVFGEEVFLNRWEVGR